MQTSLDNSADNEGTETSSGTSETDLRRSAKLIRSHYHTNNYQVLKSIKIKQPSSNHGAAVPTPTVFHLV